MISKLIFSALFITSFSSFSQIDSEEYLNSKQIFAEAASFMVKAENETDESKSSEREKNYNKAFDMFLSINQNDTAFFDSRRYAISCASGLRHYDTIIKIVNDVLAMKTYNSSKESFINSKGHALIRQNKIQAAQDVFLNGLKEFPKSYLFYYNLAVTYEDQEKYNEAVEALQSSIHFNPKYYRSHLKLGVICARAGYTTKAALSMNMAVFLAAASDNGLYVISNIEKLYGGNFENDIDELKFREEEEFDEVDLMIQNKLALNDKYKVKSKIQYSLIKHNHLLFEKIEYKKGNNGFWNQNYVDLFKEIFDENKYEMYSYFILLKVDNKKVQDVIKKSESKLIEFLKWAYDEYTEKMNARMIWNGTKYEKNKLIHMGEYGFNEEYIVVDGKRTGSYIGYTQNGVVKTRGQFDEKGDLSGLWTYNDSKGLLEVTQEIVKGVAQGRRTTYYKNGSRRKEFVIKDDAIDGDIISYYAINQVSSKVPNSKLGKKEGRAVYYHEAGEISYEVDYSNDKINGDYLSYYFTGREKVKSKYVNGNLAGDYVSYNKNGTIESKGQFEDDKREGPWEFYHENGELRLAGEFKGNLKIGIWKEYRKNGSLESESDYGVTGKKTGVYKEYDNYGKLILELVYKGDEIFSYKNYDENGNILNEETKKKKKLSFINYHPNGKKKVEGEYYKGEAVGVWSYYNINGILTSAIKYNDEGVLNGISKWYFDNGKLETVKEFKDGEANGYFVDYFRSGKIYKHGWLLEGEKAGLWEYFYKNGVKSKDEYYLEGVSNGDVRFYDEKGRLEEVSHYFFGTKMGIYQMDTLGKVINELEIVDGKAKSVFNDIVGKKRTLLEYKGGYPYGEHKGYYSSGKLEYVGEKKYGNNVGEWKWYFENGDTRTEGRYETGDKVGDWKWYFESGKIWIEKNYKLGEIDGVAKRYYENGQLESKKSYDNGERHGLSTYYDLNGHVQYVRFYHRGKLVGYSYEGKDGKLVDTIKFDGENGEILAFFSNGKKSYSAKYVNGYSEGIATFYHFNGNVSESMPYQSDLLDGTLKKYYPSGKLRVEYQYTEGDQNGYEKHYYENGQLESTEQYMNDDKYGWATYYKESGSIDKKVYFYNDRQITK